MVDWCVHAGASSVVEGAEHGGGTSNPDGGLQVGWDVHIADKVGRLAGSVEHTSTGTSLVAGALIVFFVALEVFSWLEVNQWHLAVEFGLNKSVSNMTKDLLGSDRQ